jgi:peptide-methionine (R)-S-oxide reductase
MPDATTTRRALLGAGLLGAAGIVLFRGAGEPAEAAGQAFEITRSPQDWRKALGPQRYAVLREAVTERAGSSPLLNEHRKGLFACAGCNLPLFASDTKFESGTGWPSFFRALPHAVVTRTDRTFGMSRTEVLCRRCGGHLGHLFDDGPKPTGLRYCMNGLALVFRPA